MAFPDDYHINEVPCTDKMGLHNWSTMGHPMGHRCIYCHRVKWVQNPDERVYQHQNWGMLPRV